MQEDPDDDISKLLRLKRFEQPSPEYFENFLQDFKDRQRSQMLREPAWRIAWDRVCAFLGERTPARIGYGFAYSAVLIAAAIASINIRESAPLGVASIPEQRPAAQADSLNLNTQADLTNLPALDARTAQTGVMSPPRYVMDTRPVSYEPPSSF